MMALYRDQLVLLTEYPAVKCAGLLTETGVRLKVLGRRRVQKAISPIGISKQKQKTASLQRSKDGQCAEYSPILILERLF